MGDKDLIPKASEGRAWTRGLGQAEARGCVFLRSPPACLARASGSETFFVCEICCSALPAQLLLFIGTGPGRPGRNYLSLGHAWCLAERTASLLHGSC